MRLRVLALTVSMLASSAAAWAQAPDASPQTDQGASSVPRSDRGQRGGRGGWGGGMMGRGVLGTVTEVAADVHMQVAMVYVAKSKVQKMLREEIQKLEAGA